ncbi:hypothetical protein [Hymenobacter sp. YC55]|uniref:hypothetical protein n=1 Tax=Hymenobacter sp. YC55 TaxID=3034019 RepID=UPI0023F74874|nr:hypothetical protein [Hymenobacter sp. YC55]MDF7815252.1 hypothetical protein [Hymenobacter sp. YC55]
MRNTTSRTVTPVGWPATGSPVRTVAGGRSRQGLVELAFTMGRGGTDFTSELVAPNLLRIPLPLFS